MSDLSVSPPPPTEPPYDDDLVTWLRAQLDEDESWALEASRHTFDGHMADGGAHWQWECSEHDEPITPEPLTQEFLECPATGFVGVSLRSVERYPYGTLPGTGPTIYFGAEEVAPAAGGHIVRHDPARVLRRWPPSAPGSSQTRLPEQQVAAGEGAVLVHAVAEPFQRRRQHPHRTPAGVRRFDPRPRHPRTVPGHAKSPPRRRVATRG
jgi:hypothetical protein